MKNPLQLTSKMLDAIISKAKEINFKLPHNINFKPYVHMEVETGKITLILATGSDFTSYNYFKYSKNEILQLLKEKTQLNWILDENNIFVLTSGYIVFSDDEGIEEYHKIEGCEYHLEAIYLNGRETTRHEIGEDWEMDIDDFDFERENEYKKGNKNVNTGQ